MAISLEQFKRENTQVGATNKPMSLEEFKRKKQTEQTGDQPTAVGGLIRSIAKPFVQTRANVKAIGQTIRGEEPTGIQSKYFGDVAPIKVDITKSPFEKENLRAIGQSAGTGAEIASYLPVGTGAKAMAQIAKEPFKKAIGQSAKIIGKEGVVQGGLGSLGRSMQEGEDLGTTLVNTAGGMALGGLFGAGLGAGTTAISRGLSKTPKSFMDARVDENIRKAMSGTTGDLQTLETRAVKAKNALQRLVNANDIEIPDTTAPLGSGANKRFNISKATPNEFLSAVKAQEQNIAKIGRDSAEEASKMGRIIDTNPAKNVVIQAVKNGDISVPRAKRFMMEIESLGNDPAKVHDWVQNVNIKYAPKYEKGRINQTMTSRMADSIAETFRKELNKNVYRDEYAQAYGDNKELKRLLVSVAKKANRKVDFGDISSDAGLDAAVSILTGNPLFMARTLADSAFRNVIRNIRNQSGLKAMRRAGSVASKIDGGPQMPTGGIRPQLRLPARSSTMGTQMTGGKMNMPRRGAVPLGLGDEPSAQSIRRVDSDVKPYVDNYGEAMSEVESLMDLSRAGYRVFDDTGVGTNVKAVKSTFPTWISEDLRSKELFDRVLGKIKNNMNLIGSKEKRLYNEMKEEVLRRLDDKKNVSEDSLAIKANEMSFEEFKDFYGKNKNKFTEKIDDIKKFWEENNLGGNQAFGAIAGLEIDENGELKFNKEKALMGVGGLAVAKKAGLMKGAKNISDDLIQEAKKYKSAEEFVKAQKEKFVAEQGFEPSSMKVVDDWFQAKQIQPYIGIGGQNPEFFANKPRLSEMPKKEISKYLKFTPEGKAIYYRGIPGNVKTRDIRWGDFLSPDKGKASFYGKVEKYEVDPKFVYQLGDLEAVYFNPADKLKAPKPISLSQLTDIYNKAQEPVLRVKQTDPLFEEAKKYKSAEEFVNKVDITKTPEFKKWAGNNKVVEVYHGSPYEFSSFKSPEKTFNVSGQPTSGISFSDDPKLAERFKYQIPENIQTKNKEIIKKYKNLVESTKTSMVFTDKNILEKISKKFGVNLGDSISYDELSAIRDFVGNRELKNALNNDDFSKINNFLNSKELLELNKLKQSEFDAVSALQPDGKLYRAYIKANDIKEIDGGVGFGANRNEIVDNLKDGQILKINMADTGGYIGTEYIVKNPKDIFIVNAGKTKSQLEDIWKKANNKNRQAGFINPKILGAGALATGAIGATQIPANVSYKRPPETVETTMNTGNRPKGKDLGKPVIGTNYDPYDPDQTRPNANGEGAVSGVKIKEGMVAVPRKVGSDEAMIRLGTVVYIPELDDIFLVADLMNRRFDGQYKFDFAKPHMKKNPDPSVNKTFNDVVILREGDGYGDTREFVNSGEWEKMKEEFKNKK